MKKSRVNGLIMGLIMVDLGTPGYGKWVSKWVNLENKHLVTDSSKNAPNPSAHEHEEIIEGDFHSQILASMQCEPFKLNMGRGGKI